MAPAMEHGLQTTAVYWELQMNPHNGMLGQPTYGQKWSWKLVDDDIRKKFGLDDDARNSPYVFHNDKAFDRGYVRVYKGDRDVYDIEPTKKKWNFTFQPTGTNRTSVLNGDENRGVQRADAFSAVLKSCLKADLAAAVEAKRVL